MKIFTHKCAFIRSLVVFLLIHFFTFSSLFALDLSEDEADYELFSAIKSADAQRIAELTYGVINIPIDSDSGETILTKSIKIASGVNSIKILIDNGADANKRDANGKNALMIAIENKCKADVIEVLVENTDDINTSDSLGRTALMYAVMNNCTNDIIRILLKNGADLNAKDNYQDTVLIYTVIALGDSKDIDILDFFLKNGLDLDCKNPDGVSQLTQVLQNTRNYDVISKIVANTKDTKSKDNICKWDALMYACVLNHKSDVIKLLISSGCDPNGCDKYGNNPLMLGLANNLNKDSINLLISNTTNINQRDNISGKTALILSLENNASFDIVKALIANKADVNASLQSGIYRGMSVLMFAAKQNTNLDVVKALVENGAVLSAKDGFGKTVYRYAFENPNTQIAEYIWHSINGKD